jgi:hypothetical protein
MENTHRIKQQRNTRMPDGAQIIPVEIPLARYAHVQMCRVQAALM